MNEGWPSFMERRVKERLIGAAILVVLIVLIVPELLSGPGRPPVTAPAGSAGAAEPIRNVTVDLATSKAPEAEDSASASLAASAPATPGETAHTAAPGGSVSGEVDVAAGHRASAPPTITTLQAQQPAEPALENPAPPPKSVAVAPKSAANEPDTHHHWAVQLGSFESSANAEKLERRLKAQSFSAYISSIGAGSALRYRVRVGPLNDRSAAEKIVARLKNDGYSAGIVAP